MATNLYEGRFVVDAAKGGAEFTEAIRYIANLLTRNGAEIERIEKWDERKLAYPVKRVKRGIYILTYFRADGSAISEIRRTIGLSEEVLRVLMVKAEAPGQVKGELYTPEGELIEPVTEAPAAPATEATPAPATEAAEPEGEGEPSESETAPEQEPQGAGAEQSAAAGEEA